MPVFGYQKSKSVADIRHNQTLDAEAYLHGYPINPPVQVQEISARTTSNSWLTMRPEFGKHETACYQKEIASSLASRTPELNAAKGVDFMSKSMKQIEGRSSTLTTQRTAVPIIHAPRMGEHAFAEHREQISLALPDPEEKSIVSSAVPISVEAGNIPSFLNKPMPIPQEITNLLDREATLITSNCEPIIEEPKTPELLESDIEDGFIEDPDEIPMIELNMKEFTTNLETMLDAASIPTPKLKNVSHLQTEHLVYELPDSHELLEKLDKREPDDPSPYLRVIWKPGETANSIQPPETKCDPSGSGSLCNEKTCYSCNGIREANSQTVRGTLLIPCRTAMRGSFPLNGTYFQVNEVFADHKSSLNPINVPRKFLWNLPRRTVYFGTSVSTIFKGLSAEQIQYCFWRVKAMAVISL
ncbi:hypothetical protein K7X08_003198 [Anisodus acutangulus]|uniref:Uncharacterized protein n=1 Tax=Anisodus acutangulus TaxID=402998 RepID=A0A9Q1MDL1_9SOLA|nr:hypothetical protein K7X08_003198 [Anisodus acutangulus]